MAVRAAASGSRRRPITLTSSTRSTSRSRSEEWSGYPNQSYSRWASVGTRFRVRSPCPSRSGGSFIPCGSYYVPTSYWPYVVLRYSYAISRPTSRRNHFMTRSGKTRNRRWCVSRRPDARSRRIRSPKSGGRNDSHGICIGSSSILTNAYSNTCEYMRDAFLISSIFPNKAGTTGRSILQYNRDGRLCGYVSSFASRRRSVARSCGRGIYGASGGGCSYCGIKYQTRR